jgi:F0F1-type ATP synthase assembly protein I
MENRDMNSDSPDRQQKTDLKKERISSIYQTVAPFLTMGFQLAAAVVVFILIGHWCDKKFGIEPFGKLAGLLVGCTGGFIKFFKTVASITADEKEQRVKNKHED